MCFSVSMPLTLWVRKTYLQLCGHYSYVKRRLQWLPIEQRIKCNTFCLCYQIIIGTAPSTWLNLSLRFFGGYNLSHPSKEGWSYLLLSSTNGILFLLLRFTSLLSLFGKLVLKLTFKEYFDQQLLLCCENRESSPFRLLFVLWKLVFKN